MYCPKASRLKKFSPAAEDLSHQKSQHHHISSLEEAHLLDPADNVTRNNPRDDASINGQTSLADIEDIQKIIR